MRYILYIVLGLLPSLIWLSYFLRKDVHPESNRKIIDVFLWGAFSAVPTALAELFVLYVLNRIFHLSGVSDGLAELVRALIGIALMEELFKYFVVKYRVLKDPEFDEPIDVMIYMVIAALGFAALENILYLFTETNGLSVYEPFQIIILRFAFATFLHALASGTLGFFIALSFCDPKKRRLLFSIGLAIAVLSHGFYNFGIIRTVGENKLLIPVLILGALTIVAFYGFKRMKILSSICKVR